MMTLSSAVIGYFREIGQAGSDLSSVGLHPQSHVPPRSQDARRRHAAARGSKNRQGGILALITVADAEYSSNA
jgi:hypothetical protein